LRRPRTSGAGSQVQLYWRRISQSEIRKNTAGRKSGRAKIFTLFLRSKFAGPSPKTLSFLPAQILEVTRGGLPPIPYFP